MRRFPLSSAPRALNALLSPARRVTLYGTSDSSISMHYAAETACEKRPVIYICGDNRFNPYAIARLARRLHHRCEDALNRILVARAFTGFQFNELIQRLKPDEASGPVIVSGICSTFMDEDMSHNDAARLYYRALWRLAELADRGMSFLLCESQEIACARRAHFLNDLYKASNFIFRLNDERSYTLEMLQLSPAPADRFDGKKPTDVTLWAEL
jgi:hypothetical protein